jgi:hypothetical protein
LVERARAIEEERENERERGREREKSPQTQTQTYTHTLTCTPLPTPTQTQAINRTYPNTHTHTHTHTHTGGSGLRPERAGGAGGQEGRPPFFSMIFVLLYTSTPALSFLVCPLLLFFFLSPSLTRSQFISLSISVPTLSDILLPPFLDSVAAVGYRRARSICQPHTRVLQQSNGSSGIPPSPLPRAYLFRTHMPR